MNRAATPCWTNELTAESSSLTLATLWTCNVLPNAAAVARASRTSVTVLGLRACANMPIGALPDTSEANSSSRFATSLLERNVTPVTFASGRLKLWTNPLRRDRPRSQIRLVSSQSLPWLQKPEAWCLRRAPSPAAEQVRRPKSTDDRAGHPQIDTRILRFGR